MPSANQIDAAAANFPAGLALDLYIGDELNSCPKAYPLLRAMGANAHAANRSVKTMMTTDRPHPDLYNDGHGRSAIDHWVLLASAQKWHSLPAVSGGDLWSYTSCNTGFGNAPEWLVDYPPINEAYPDGFLELDARSNGHPLLPRRRMDRRETPSAVGTMWILRLAAAAWEDRAMEYFFIPRVRSPRRSPLGDTYEGHSRRHSRLRIRSDSQET